MLEARDVTKVYQGRRVLQRVSVRLERSQTAAVVGPSGSGKTTLLYCLAGLENPDGGDVLFSNTPMGSLCPESRAQMRLSHFGFVFQSADLVPELSLWDNIALPLELRGEKSPAVKSRVGQLVDELGLESCARQRPHEVSGGEAQRAAVGRAVAGRPKVVFADEPTGSLDEENRAVVLSMLMSQVKAHDALLVMVSHDPSVVPLVDTVLRLRDGHLEGE